MFTVPRIVGAPKLMGLFLLLAVSPGVFRAEAQATPPGPDQERLILIEGPSNGRGVPGLPPNAWQRFSATYDYAGLRVRIHLVPEPPLPAEGFVDAECSGINARRLSAAQRQYVLLSLGPLQQLVVDLPSAISNPCRIVSAWISGFLQFSQRFPDGRTEFPAIVLLAD